MYIYIYIFDIYIYIFLSGEGLIALLKNVGTLRSSTLYAYLNSFSPKVYVRKLFMFIHIHYINMYVYVYYTYIYNVCTHK